jgi:hypothetical protein
MEKNKKNILAIIVFVIVSFYCMMTGWWIFWAGITTILYADFVIESTREWLDARQLRYLEAMKVMQLSNTPHAQSIEQSILDIEQRIRALEDDKTRP